MCACSREREKERGRERVGWREEGREDSGREGRRENSQTTQGNSKCQVNRIESIIREDWLAVPEMTTHSSMGT